MRRGVENPDSPGAERAAAAPVAARAGLLLVGLIVAVGPDCRAQASGTMRAAARVVEAEAGQAVLAAARSVGVGPIPGRTDVGLATISVREERGRPASPTPGPPSSRGTPKPEIVVPTRVVSIQFLRN